MARDPASEAFEEWAEDAMRRTSRMPSRNEAFLAGWQYAVDYLEGLNERQTSGATMEICSGRDGIDTPGDG